MKALAAASERAGRCADLVSIGSQKGPQQATGISEKTNSKPRDWIAGNA